MTEIALYHSVLGVRAGVLEAAEVFREAGHQVHVIDLYEGAVFDDYTEAFAFVESFGGIGELMRRTMAGVDGLPAELVYAGFSNGGGSAIVASAGWTRSAIRIRWTSSRRRSGRPARRTSSSTTRA